MQITKTFDVSMDELVALLHEEMTNKEIIQLVKSLDESMDDINLAMQLADYFNGQIRLWAEGFLD